MSARRRISLVLAAACAALPLSACTIQLGDGGGDGGSAAPATPTQGGGTSGMPAQAGPTQELRVGSMSIRIPVSWAVVPDGKDGVRRHVVTSGSCERSGYPDADGCRGWWVFGAADIAVGNELRPYTPDRPFYPRTDSVPCPSDPETFQTTPQTPSAQGFAQVGSHKGHHREWAITCISPAGGAKTGGFVQRVIYLPDSRILLVDNWQTPGLMDHLAAATWS